MNKIFVVKGDAGMYSDWRTWDIRAYTTKESAQKQVRELTTKKNEVLKTLNLRDESWLNDLPKEDLERLEKLGVISTNEYGRPCATDCDGADWLSEIEDVNYTYEEVELKDEQ